MLVLLCTVILICCKEESDTPPDNNDNGNNNDTTYNPTPFENVPVPVDVVMYEVNLRAFSTTGDLQGVINRLDKIKSLGVNVIWLMPIHPIGEINSVNSPYSVKDYKAISYEYGTLDDLRNLTDEAHERDMAVIMDWVANHTAWDNEWINNTSWYTQDGNGNIIHPPGTNWLDVADLNYNNTDMQNAMIDAMKYWILQANVDGFRCDYADGVPYSFWKRAFDTLVSLPEREYVLLAEGTRDDHYAAGFDLTFGWSFYGKLKDVYNGQSANGLITTHNSAYNNVPEGKHILRFTTNHDESAWDNTPMVLFNGKEGALAASVATIFIGGVPLFYTGQEVGRVENVPFFSNSPINWNDNPDMFQAYKDLMDYYSQSGVARNGENQSYSHADVFCFKKTYNYAELVVIVNMRDSQINFSIPAELHDTTWTDALTNETITLETTLQLDNYQYILLKK
jgi:glycosidase